MVCGHILSIISVYIYLLFDFFQSHEIHYIIVYGYAYLYTCIMSSQFGTLGYNIDRDHLRPDLCNLHFLVNKQLWWK